MGDVIVDDEAGNDDVESSRDIADDDSASRWTTERAEDGKAIARRLGYALSRDLLQTVASMNDIVESTPRFMEFARTLRETNDLQQAIYNADDITGNFKRKGSGDTARAVNAGVMFNNAAIQGIDKTRRTMISAPPEKRRKKFLKWIMHAIVVSAITVLYNKFVDDEGYKNLSSYKKNNFYNFAIGDGKFISLPKERENAVFNSLVERTLERMCGNEEAFFDFAGYVAGQLLPPMIPDSLNPADALHSVLGSTVLGGIADVGFNKDFKGTPIESKSDENLPSNERYSETTTKAAYYLGQTGVARKLEISPKQIDHIISSYTGIIGQANKASSEVCTDRLKNEMFYGRSWIDVSMEAFIDEINSYINWYNTKRIKQSLDYMSPVEYRHSLGLTA